MKELLKAYEQKINQLAIQYGITDVSLDAILIESHFNHYQVGCDILGHIYTVGIFNIDDAENKLDDLYDTIYLELIKIKLEVLGVEDKGDNFTVVYYYDYEQDLDIERRILVSKEEFYELEDDELTELIKDKLKDNYLQNV